MPAQVSMKQLLEAGVHFGHQTRRWNPAMRRFIFTERNGLHILDLQQTVNRLTVAFDYVRDLSASGGTILFVGTKKQAQDAVEAEATRCGMPYVTNRWLGGTMTNFSTIQSRIDHLVRLEDQQARGEFDVLLKKEVLKIEEEIVRLNRHFGGVKEMTKLPSALFIIDLPKERIAVMESLRLHIPIVAMCDTNSDPDEVDYPIPSNDDAIRAIKLMCSKMAEAVIEGREMREAGMEADTEDGVGNLVFSQTSFSPDDEPAVPEDERE